MPATARGHWGFGFHLNAKAMALTIEKPRNANVAVCTVFRQNYVGRLAADPLVGGKRGYSRLAATGSSRSEHLSRPSEHVRLRSAPTRSPSRYLRSRGPGFSRHRGFSGRLPQDQARGRAREEIRRKTSSGIQDVLLSCGAKVDTVEQPLNPRHSVILIEADDPISRACFDFRVVQSTPLFEWPVWSRHTHEKSNPIESLIPFRVASRSAARLGRVRGTRGGYHSDNPS